MSISTTAGSTNPATKPSTTPEPSPRNSENADAAITSTRLAGRAPATPAPGEDGPKRRHSTVKQLRRLAPYAKPAMPYLIASAVTAGIATVCGLAFPLVIQAIIDGPITDGNLAGLWPLGILLAILGIGEAGLFFVRRILIARPVMRVEARMREDLYDKLQRLPVSFHDRWPAGQLLSRGVSDLSTIRRFLAFGLIFLIVNIATFVIGVGILLWLAWDLGLVVAALAIPLVLLSFVYESRYRVLARRSQDQVGDLATTVEESILGIRILKAFGRSAHLRKQFLGEARDLRATELGKARVISVLWAVIIALPEIALGIVLLLGVREVAAGTLTAGALVGFFGVAMGLRWPIDSIGWLLAIANDTASATERFYEVMDTPIDITSPAGPVQPARSDGHLEFVDVGFRFADARADAPELLDGFSLDLRPGETVALVGATGSGKTTLTSLVNRLYDVTSGSIRLDGVDIRELDLTDLRRRVAVAFEEPTLFSASVRENVLLGHPNGTDEELAEALQVAQAEFVYDLPWGLDTRIGEQGLSLSGGQRQRLALSRAVVGRPEVLVLDDPLSALDIHTEAQVEAALRSVLASTTSLVVAHRASTVMLADRVALIENGRITALGAHSELMATVPAYRNLLASKESVLDDEPAEGVQP